MYPIQHYRAIINSQSASWIKSTFPTWVQNLLHYVIHYARCQIITFLLIVLLLVFLVSPSSFFLFVIFVLLHCFFSSLLQRPIILGSLFKAILIRSTIHLSTMYRLWKQGVTHLFCLSYVQPSKKTFSYAGIKKSKRKIATTKGASCFRSISLHQIDLARLESVWFVEYEI